MVENISVSSILLGSVYSIVRGLPTDQPCTVTPQLMNELGSGLDSFGRQIGYTVGENRSGYKIKIKQFEIEQTNTSSKKSNATSK